MSHCNEKVKVDTLIVKDKLVVRGNTKLDNDTRVDKLCFKDNGEDGNKWYVQESSDNKLTFVYEGTAGTSVELRSDGTIETTGDVVVKGSLKPFRFVRVLKEDGEDQSVPSGALTTVSFQKYMRNQELTFDFTNQQFVAPQDGIYSIDVQLNYEANGVGVRQVGIEVVLNSAQRLEYGRATNATVGASVSTPGHYSTTLFLNKSDTVTVIQNQNSGSNLLVLADRVATYLEITQLR